ncbi:hypothetical protein WCN65_15280, partial [Staphylococcus aureus]
QILEIVKSDKVLKQVVERVNQDNQVDVAALNHVIEKYVMDQILEIVKSDKVLKQVVERVNQDNQVDVAALNH